MAAHEVALRLVVLLVLGVKSLRLALRLLGLQGQTLDLPLLNLPLRLRVAVFTRLHHEVERDLVAADVPVLNRLTEEPLGNPLLALAAERVRRHAVVQEFERVRVVADALLILLRLHRLARFDDQTLGLLVHRLTADALGRRDVAQKFGIG